MNNDIQNYSRAQPAEYRDICAALADLIDTGCKRADSKIWHRAPVWFIDDNPIVGYWVRKGYVQLLFWSGQSFNEPGLSAEGKFKAAEIRLTDVNQIKPRDVKRWLKAAHVIQWDYKNIVKRRGVLEKLGTW